MENEAQRNPKPDYPSTNRPPYGDLQAAVASGQPYEIVYQDESGNPTQVISLVTGLITEDAVEYVRLENNATIRLDQIERVSSQTEVDAHTTDRTSGTARTQQAMTRESTAQYGTYEAQRDRVEEARMEGEPVSEQTQQAQDLEDRVQPKAVTDEQVPAVDETPADVRAKRPDLGHEFATSTGPLLLAENAYYRLMADRLRNRLYMTVKQLWPTMEAVPELGNHLANIARFMTPPFTLLNDLTSIRPDETGTIESPDVPGKDALLSAGLTKVSDLVPPDCETLVHGIHSFSVNSLRMRYFKDRIQAENWLTGNYPETETSEKNLGLE